MNLVDEGILFDSLKTESRTSETKMCQGITILTERNSRSLAQEKILLLVRNRPRIWNGNPQSNPTSLVFVVSMWLNDSQYSVG